MEIILKVVRFDDFFSLIHIEFCRRRSPVSGILELLSVKILVKFLRQIDQLQTKYVHKLYTYFIKWCGLSI